MKAYATRLTFEASRAVLQQLSTKHRVELEFRSIIDPTAVGGVVCRVSLFKRKCGLDVMVGAIFLEEDTTGSLMKLHCEACKQLGSDGDGIPPTVNYTLADLVRIADAWIK